MARLIFSERFADDLAELTSQRVEARVFECLDLIERFPDIGSLDLPESIHGRFGGAVRKFVVDAYDIIYTHEPDAEDVYIEALIPAKAAR